MKRLCCLICFILFASILEAVNDPNSNEIIKPSDHAEKYAQQVEASKQEASYTPIIFIYILLVSGLIWFGWRYFKHNGMLPGRDLKSDEIAQVRVLGTKPLGNKQNLMVVEFDGRRLLLGVGPGFITNLTDSKATDSKATDSKAPPKFTIEEEPPKET